MTEPIYLLTGATGLLGSNILASLLDEGCHVRVLVRNPEKKKVLDGAEVVKGGLLDRQALDRFFDTPPDVDVIVIHAAGIVTLNPDAHNVVYETNVIGTANIIRECIEHDVRKLVYVSSTSALPETAQGTIFESTTHDPTSVIGYYSKTKAEASNLVLEASQKDGLNASIVYPSGIIGPGDHNVGLITSAIRFFAGGKLPVSIGGSFNSVDVRDVSEGIISCARNAGPGETFIMAGECHTVDELLDCVTGEAGVRKPRFSIPLRLLYPLAWIGTQIGKITGKQVVFTDYTVYNLERNNDYSSAKAEQQLGFHARPLRVTVADTIKWLKKEGLIRSRPGR